MNFILTKLDKLEFHTNLTALFAPLVDCLGDYQFFISDYLFLTDDQNLPIKNFKSNYEKLDYEKFKKILESRVQFIWLYISAIPKNENIIIDEDNLPYVEGNPEIWESQMQMQNAAFEIYAYDTTYTILKFKDRDLSDKFKEYFREAESLEEYEF